MSIQDKIRQDKSRQVLSSPNLSIQGKTIQYKACHCKTGQDMKSKFSQGLSRKDKTCLDRTRIVKTKQDKTNLKTKGKIMGTSFAAMAQCVLVISLSLLEQGNKLQKVSTVHHISA